MPVPYRPAHPPYMPATPSPNPRHQYSQFRQPYLRPGISPVAGFPPYPGMMNHMRPPMPVAYGVPVMVPFPVYALPTAFDQDEDEGVDRRERAYPPSGPRLFQGYGSSPAPTNGRRTGRDQATCRNEGRFEVHHPDGTVEIGHDEPMIEELDDNGEVAVQEEGGEDDTSVPERRSTMLYIENVAQANSGLDETQPTPSCSSLEPTSGRYRTSPPTGPSDDHNSLECANPRPVDERRASSGIQAPCHTPEATPFSTLIFESDAIGSVPGDEISPVFQREAEDEGPEVAIQPMADHFTCPRGHTRRSSAESEVRHRQSSLPANITDGPGPIGPRYTTPQKINKSPKLTSAGLDPKPSAYTGTLASPSTPELSQPPPSASLPSPEAAQVLDRLLEITGLSARQFMIKLERGEFHMDGASGGEGN